ncbi:MAG: response regulator transcription factor [Verrucomicrobiales bacterium]|nr:response regulator transcription factor [Verrucomicrobiales bacterium]
MTAHLPSIPIKVALVEDSDRYRESLVTLLRGAPNLTLLWAVPTAEEALRRAASAAPDVLLVDLELPEMSGIECIRRLKLQRPGLHLLVLTNFDDNDRIFGAIQPGASGYVVKRASFSTILEAIREVHAGGAPMTPHIARRVLESLYDPTPTEPLTKREEEVLRLAREGRTYRQIADTLGIAYDTVRTHFNRIYQKLHVHSRAEAVRKHSSRRPRD